MWKDHIVVEVRRIRDAQAKKYDFDVRAIMTAAAKRQKKSGLKVVSFASERPQKEKTASRKSSK
jgi:hypothetical protein